MMHFPNESNEYRRARAALLDEEIELRQWITRVAELRAKLPAGGAVKEDYSIDEVDGYGIDYFAENEDGDQMPTGYWRSQ